MLFRSKVLATMFELVPIINSIKDRHIHPDAIGANGLVKLLGKMSDYLERILGLQAEKVQDIRKLNGVIDLLLDIRKDARARKDFLTSDKIRDQLLALGILLKDEKDGRVTISFA